MTAAETNKDRLSPEAKAQWDRRIPLEELDPARLERLRAKTAKYLDGDQPRTP